MKKKKLKKNLSELKVDYVETSPGRFSVVDTETGEIVDEIGRATCRERV